MCELVLNDPAYLIYTSGTTGQPKGALLPHRSLFGHLTGFDCYYEFPTSEDIIWTPADWAWIGGLMDVLVPAWYYGMTVVSTDADFDPADAVDFMERHEGDARLPAANGTQDDEGRGCEQRTASASGDLHRRRSSRG